MSSHERPNEGATNVWLTPRWVIDALGPFDLDPCAATVRPFDCARENYTVEQDGFSLPWHGTVWMNPPYGPHVGRWLGRLTDHGDGIALVFARTETKAMQPALAVADAILFIEGRLVFLYPTGEAASMNAGAPSMLLAFGDKCAERLRNCDIPGVLVTPQERESA